MSFGEGQVVIQFLGRSILCGPEGIVINPQLLGAVHSTK